MSAMMYKSNYHEAIQQVMTGISSTEEEQELEENIYLFVEERSTAVVLGRC
jgi:hypothetical protein